ncbi:hypothetical protein R4172_17790 [Rhodococcus kroppenstedtii]|nr:hypothetical protein [Rhodococcus kroppenstedtii]MDV7199399.1 hypothetical protein [Rhodococcus kroppenstedtii]
MMYPLVRELAADGIPVAVTCRVLHIARQPYYRWLAAPVTTTELEEAYRADALFDAHRDDPEFGYRFLVDEATDAGQKMASRTAWRICSANRWWSSFGKKREGRAGGSQAAVLGVADAVLAPCVGPVPGLEKGELAGRGVADEGFVAPAVAFLEQRQLHRRGGRSWRTITRIPAGHSERTFGSMRPLSSASNPDVRKTSTVA